jgi:Contractile injection system tube protein/LysM domain
MPKLLKATLQRVGISGSLEGPLVEVSFNPTEYTLNKAVQIAEVPIPGLDSPVLQFVRGQTETLAFDLFFDSTEGGMDDNATSVTAKTDQFYQLLKIEGKLHAPPVCFFSWGPTFPGNRAYAKLGNETGSQHRYGFKCLIESVRQRFTLFSPKGMPLRATLSVSLKEYKTLSEQIDTINKTSPDHTHAHVVQFGETISQIAYKVYSDPAHWRAIAAENKLTDPLNLSPGQILQAPVLSRG